VLELRYGFGGEPPHTLDEIERTFNSARSTSPANASPKSKTSRSRSSKTSAKPGSLRDVGIASGYAPRALRHRS